jgi:hypothetical protein
LVIYLKEEKSAKPRTIRIKNGERLEYGREKKEDDGVFPRVPILLSAQRRRENMQLRER